MDGWRVLRPERDAPSLRWEDYLQWAGAQSRRGVPVLEIHGQGAMEDGRFLQGVLGTRRSPLNAELAEEVRACARSALGVACSLADAASRTRPRAPVRELTHSPACVLVDALEIH